MGTESAATYQRIAFFRPLQLGDLMCAIPALRAIRAAAPSAAVTLIGLPWAREFTARFDRYIDHFLEFPGYPGLPERPADVEAFPGFVEAAQRQSFDLAVQAHGNGRITNSVVLTLGAKAIGGFYPDGGPQPDLPAFLPYPEGEHEIWRLLRLVDFLGFPPAGEDLEFPLYTEDRAALAGAVVAGLEGPYVVVHPGGSAANRRWPPRGFALVADAIARRGFSVVLTGTNGEAGLTRQVAAAMDQPSLDLCGRTSLGAIGALIEGAALVVCNDTGVSHIAASLRTPSVVVAVGTDAARRAPLDTTRHRTVTAGRPWSSAAHSFDEGFRPGPAPDAVLSAALDLLAGARIHAA